MDVVGKVWESIEIVFVVAGQTPFFMVHEKFVVENGEPAATVTAVVAKFTLVSVLVPAKVLHVPVPAAGTLAAITVVVPQMFMDGPGTEAGVFV